MKNKLKILLSFIFYFEATQALKISRAGYRKCSSNVLVCTEAEGLSGQSASPTPWSHMTALALFSPPSQELVRVHLASMPGEQVWWGDSHRCDHRAPSHCAPPEGLASLEL